MLKVIEEVSEGGTYNVNSDGDSAQTEDSAWEVTEAIEDEGLEAEGVEVEEVGFRELLTRRSNNLVSLGALRVSSLASDWKSTLLTSAEAVGVK